MKINKTSSPHLPLLTSENLHPPSPPLPSLLLNSTQLDQLSNQLRMLNINDDSINKVLKQLKIIKNESISINNSFIQPNDLFEYILSQLLTCDYGHVLSSNFYKNKKRKQNIKNLVVKKNSKNKIIMETQKLNSQIVKKINNDKGDKDKLLEEMLKKNYKIIDNCRIKVEAHKTNQAITKLLTKIISKSQNLNFEGNAPLGKLVFETINTGNHLVQNSFPKENNEAIDADSEIIQNGMDINKKLQIEEQKTIRQHSKMLTKNLKLLNTLINKNTTIENTPNLFVETIKTTNKFIKTSCSDKGQL